MIGFLRTDWALYGTLVAISAGCAAMGDVRSAKSVSDTSTDINLPDARSPADWRRWEQDLRQQLVTDPSNAGTHARLGYVYHRQGQLLAARKSLDRASTLAPRDASIRLLYGQVLYDCGDARAALRQAETAVRLDENSGAAHLLCGTILKSTGHNFEALEAFRAGWQARPPSIPAGLALARWELQHGELTAAAERLRLCTVHAPDHAGARELYAQVLERQGDYSAAASQWEQLLARGQPGTNAYLNLARLYHMMGEPVLAARNLQDARQLAPKHLEVQELERLLATKSPHQAARPEYRSVISKTAE